MLAQLGFDNVDIKNVDETDDLRMTLTDERIIHLRPSGNAPELRCYAQADNYLTVSESVTSSLRNIQKL